MGKKYSFDNIIGRSKAIQESISLARKVAPTDTTVLLTGETGTGKEVFAQAIHQANSRSKQNFVAINCSAFSRELLENELFGHKSGAFTGATKDQKGLFEEAHNGTLFLDEIGEMALELQSKLLRILETGEFMRIGEAKPIKVNVRIIAATDRDLEKEIENGNFRSDLFYRLSVFTIPLPALKARKSDIKLLAEYYVQHFALRTNRKSLSIAADYLSALEENEWKGNIRELKNIIERSVILSENDILALETLPFELHTKKDNAATALSAFSMASIEKLHIQKVLNYAGGNKAETARLLEIGVATLYRKIEEYKLG